NADFLSGQSTSLKVGVNSLSSSANSFMLFLGDLPYIEQRTVREVFKAGLHMIRKKKGTFVIRPQYNNIPGHPVFFGNVTKELFHKIVGDKGDRAIMKNFNCQIYLDVTDEGILLDIDTPEDYKKARQTIEICQK